MLSKPLLALSAGSSKSIVHLLGQRVEREQIADGVLIFGAAQAMQQRQLAGFGFASAARSSSASKNDAAAS